MISKTGVFALKDGRVFANGKRLPSVTRLQARAMGRVLGEVAKASGDVQHFGKFVWRDEIGEPIEAAAIHRSWIMHLQLSWAAGKHAAVIAPWGHGKSEWMARIIPAFMLGQNPQLRFKVVSSGDSLAKRNVGVLAEVIGTSKRFKACFPLCRPDGGKAWNSHELYVKRIGSAPGPSYEGLSVFTRAMGERADRLIFDDMEDLDNSIKNPALRPAVIESFEQKWMSRLDGERGLAAMVGTVWHGEGLHATMRNRTDWVTLLQRVRKDCTCIEQEVYNAPAGYLEALGGYVNASAAVAA